MNSRLFSIVLGLMLCAGCDDAGGSRRNASGSIGGTGLVGSDINSLAAESAQPAAPAQAAAPQSSQAASVPAVAGQPGQAPISNAQPGTSPGSQPAGPAPAGGTLPGLSGVGLPGQPQNTVITEKAQAGVSGKGNYGPGLVTTPISVYFQAQEQVIFLKVQHALNLYEGEHGHKPKTEEEFMKQVIEFNQIRLPQLPPGSKYKYDPQKGELLVERPQ